MTKTGFLVSVILVTLALLAVAAPAKAGAAGKAFSAAAGKYKGKAGGRIVSPIAGTVVPVKKTGSFVKVPRGKGRFLANFGGVRIKGRFNRASVRQGGRKVIFTGPGTLPAVLTDPLMAGPGTGTLRAVAKLRGNSPKLTAKGSFGVEGLIEMVARFSGEK